MQNRFVEGDRVALRQDSLGLRAGASGIVWARYVGEPPAYDVTFRDENGQEFDALVTEDEITRLQVASIARSDVAA